jgi:lysophospholipase L1-like esterase
VSQYVVLCNHELNSHKVVLFSHAKATVNLRILPLGDSITEGYGSTSGSGYRAPLLTLLTLPNSTFTKTTPNITYIGTLTSGTLPPPNNANEGHSGAIISQIADFAKPDLALNGSLKGDIVLVMAGTNDMFNENVLPADAPARLGALIDELVAGWPEAAILVATLTPSANTTTQGNIVVFNEQVPVVVNERAKAGNRTLVVSMANVTLAMLYDGLHPDDTGYEVMAQAWYSGLMEAKSKGWIAEVASAGSVMEKGTWLMWLVVCCLGLATGL